MSISARIQAGHDNAIQVAHDSHINAAVGHAVYRINLIDYMELVGYDTSRIYGAVVYNYCAPEYSYSIYGYGRVVSWRYNEQERDYIIQTFNAYHQGNSSLARHNFVLIGPKHLLGSDWPEGLRGW